MPFPWTIQRYIFREMSKAFVLAAIALTGVLGLGGGVMNMIKLGEVTADEQGRPSVPYELGLRDGAALKGSLPVVYEPRPGTWVPVEGLDWHLR